VGSQDRRSGNKIAVIEEGTGLWLISMDERVRDQKKSYNFMNMDILMGG